MVVVLIGEGERWKESMKCVRIRYMSIDVSCIMFRFHICHVGQDMAEEYA